jgi:inosose dehydratase
MPGKVGNAPTSWGIEQAHDPSYPGWAQVLDEIAAAEYEGIELGPLGYLPDEPSVLARELASRRLSLSAGTVMAPLHVDDSAALDLARQTAALTGALGGPCLVLIDELDRERTATAGASDRAARLDAGQFARLVANVNQSPSRWLRPASRLPSTRTSAPMSSSGTRSTTFSAALIADCGERLAYVHLKDVDPAVLEGVLAEAASFDVAYERAFFCVLGTGCSAKSGWLARSCPRRRQPMGLATEAAKRMAPVLLSRMRKRNG